MLTAAVTGLASLAGARSGILDGLAHTSNGPTYLDRTAYCGAAHYRDVPYAVADRGVITAPGTSPVSFALTVMRQLGIGDDQLTHYEQLHAAQQR